ncbi:hypothetical protein Droror1_Dr00008871 [Drosera rotundifolia]
MSFAVAFVLSGLIIASVMTGVILDRDAGRHEINFVLLQVRDVLLIVALVSGMPLMFPPRKDKFWMLIVVWFIYFVIVAVTHYQKILSVITRSLGIGLTEHTDNPTTENGSYHHVINIPIETTTHTIPNHTATVMRPLDQNYSNSRTSYIEKKRLDREEVMRENTWNIPGSSYD